MRFALGVRFQNEAQWLALHLPIMREAVDGIVAIDGGSEDGGADVIRALGGQVQDVPFAWDFGAQANALVCFAEACGFDVLLRLDPDEVMFRSDIAKMRVHFEAGFDAVSTASHHFCRDRFHYCPQFEPDRHYRAFRLFRGFHYVNRLHETPVLHGARRLRSDLPVFHYGLLEDRDTRRLQYANYGRIAQGLQPLPALTEDCPEWDYPPHVPFEGEQPLDPHEIGARAPLEQPCPTQEPC